MEDEISNSIAGRTTQGFVAVPEIVMLGAWVEMRDNEAKGDKTPEKTAKGQRNAKARQFVLPDEEKAQYGKGKGNIFFARGGQNTGQDKPAIAFVGQCKYGIQ